MTITLESVVQKDILNPREMPGIRWAFRLTVLERLLQIWHDMLIFLRSDPRRSHLVLHHTVRSN